MKLLEKEIEKLINLRDQHAEAKLSSALKDLVQMKHRHDKILEIERKISRVQRNIKRSYNLLPIYLRPIAFVRFRRYL